MPYVSTVRGVCGHVCRVAADSPMLTVYCHWCGRMIPRKPGEVIVMRRLRYPRKPRGGTARGQGKLF